MLKNTTIRNRISSLCLLAQIFAVQVALGQSSTNVLKDILEQPQNLHPTEVVLWQSVQGEVYNNNAVVIHLRVDTRYNFTLYTDKVQFVGPSGYTHEILEHPPIEIIADPTTGSDAEVYRAGDFKILFTGGNPFFADEFPVSITFVGCTSLICLMPYTLELNIPTLMAAADFNRSMGALEASTNNDTDSKFVQSQPLADGESNIPLNSPCGGGDLEERLNCYLQQGTLPLFLILFIIFIGGVLTNLTPCVYPMIPITIRALSGQGDSPFFASSMYALGILVTYTALGLFAAWTGSLFGNIMASSGFSIVVGLVMMGLGITMLGFGNLSFLQSIGNRMGTGKSSVKNAFFMGTGAGLVASPCTGPILATLLTVAASNADFLRSSLYLFVYSFGFAVPYVFLGRASVNLSKKRVPPRLQIIVKLFFASVMFALGFYYLRIPAYGLLKSLNEAWSTISMVSLAAGAAIGFWVSISPKLQLKKGIQIVPSILFGLGIFAGTQWMSASNTKALQATLDWYDSEEAGFSAAARLGSPILVDAWAEWCEACKKMDATTFVDPTLVKKLKDDNWVLIKLDVTQTNEKNEAILAKYKIQSLPTLTLLRPGGDMGESRQILGYVSGKSLLKHIEEFGRQ